MKRGIWPVDWTMGPWGHKCTPPHTLTHTHKQVGFFFFKWGHPTLINGKCMSLLWFMYFVRPLLFFFILSCDFISPESVVGCSPASLGELNMAYDEWRAQCAVCQGANLQCLNCRGNGPFEMAPVHGLVWGSCHSRGCGINRQKKRTLLEEKNPKRKDRRLQCKLWLTSDLWVAICPNMSTMNQIKKQYMQYMLMIIWYTGIQSRFNPNTF